jgi:geranylgeranyl diphosphate synthase, type II
MHHSPEFMTETLLQSFARYCESVRPRIDAALDRHADLGDGCPARLREAMCYSLLAPGKRLRPMLVLMAAEACGGRVETAMPAAVAVEMVHAYSLIHDDLPAMDDDDLRRGRPTCHKVFGEAMAILAGDALLTLAFETLAKLDCSAEVVVGCCAALAEAAGACNLVGGQADDIEGAMGGLPALATDDSTARAGKPPMAPETVGMSADDALAHLESIHRRKTGALILVSLRLGALTARADAAQRAALERYGRCLGLAFQITDDLLDVRGDEAALGKRARKDHERGKLTFPGLLGIEPSMRRASELIDQSREAIAPLGPAAGDLEALARHVLERNR